MSACEEAFDRSECSKAQIARKLTCGMSDGYSLLLLAGGDLGLSGTLDPLPLALDLLRHLPGRAT